MRRFHAQIPLQGRLFLIPGGGCMIVEVACLQWRNLHQILSCSDLPRPVREALFRHPGAMRASIRSGTLGSRMKKRCSSSVAGSAISTPGALGRRGMYTQP